MGHSSCTWNSFSTDGKSAVSHQTWALVLAGGEGERMRPFIQDWLGEDRPKQYCAFVGRRTMLEHTHDRARRLADDTRLLTILGRGHRGYLDTAQASGKLIEQPSNLGTAPGIFVPLAHVMERDPEATVLIMPSDHFVYPEQRFLDYARAAVTDAQAMPRHIVLLGAQPDGPDPDYGYVTPAQGFGAQAAACMRVERFYEKPHTDMARTLLENGAMWNTLVCAVKAKTLWAIGWDCIPAMMEQLERYRYAVGTVLQNRADPAYELRAFMRLYSRLQPIDFSRHVLQKVPQRILLHPMHDVHWSDWGRPERIVETIERIGAEPAFNQGRLQIWRRSSKDPSETPAASVTPEYWLNL